MTFPCEYGLALLVNTSWNQLDSMNSLKDSMNDEEIMKSYELASNRLENCREVVKDSDYHLNIALRLKNLLPSNFSLPSLFLIEAKSQVKAHLELSYDLITSQHDGLKLYTKASELIYNLGLLYRNLNESDHEQHIYREAIDNDIYLHIDQRPQYLFRYENHSHLPLIPWYLNNHRSGDEYSYEFKEINDIVDRLQGNFKSIQQEVLTFIELIKTMKENKKPGICMMLSQLM